MFFLPVAGHKTEAYVMVGTDRAEEINPVPGEISVRGGRFPEEQYYRFPADGVDDHAIDVIRELELELYNECFRYKKAFLAGDSHMAEYLELLSYAKRDLEKYLADTIPDLEIVTAREIKKVLDLRDFCMTGKEETIRAYYCKDAGEVFVFLVRGNITESDYSSYADFETRFVELGADEGAERDALSEKVRQYAAEHGHGLLVVPYSQFKDTMTVTERLPRDSQEMRHSLMTRQKVPERKANVLVPKDFAPVKVQGQVIYLPKEFKPFANPDAQTALFGTVWEKPRNSGGKAVPLYDVLVRFTKEKDIGNMEPSGETKKLESGFAAVWNETKQAAEDREVQVRLDSKEICRIFDGRIYLKATIVSRLPSNRELNIILAIYLFDDTYYLVTITEPDTETGKHDLDYEIILNTFGTVQ